MSDTAPATLEAAPASVDLVGVAAEIVAAYVARNSVPVADLPGLLASVHGALVGLGAPASAEPEVSKPVPPVPIRKSVGDDFIVSLEDGKRYKSLKRHLL